MSRSRLQAGVERCIALADEPRHREAHVFDVSGWSVRQHVEHLLRADRGILDRVDGAHAEPEAGSRAGRPTPVGRFVLLTGFIPRGRGRAPDPTVPADMPLETLRCELRALRGRVLGLEECLVEIGTCRARYPHPVLGRFTPSQWLRFLAIHHRHHEKVIDDILARG